MKTKLSILTKDMTCQGCNQPNKGTLFDVPHPSGPWGYFCPACYEVFKTPETERLGFKLVLDDQKIVPAQEGTKEILARLEGYTSVEDMLEDAATDSVVPGICTACGQPAEVEPDCEHGLCSECKKPTVESCLILAGVI